MSAELDPARERLRSAERIVVKVGSSSLTREQGGALDRQRLEALVETLVDVRASGKQVVLISSGAIAAGLTPLGLARRPRDLASQQAAASVGQGLLMGAYTEEVEGGTNALAQRAQELEATGTAEKAAAERTNSLAGATAELASRWETLKQQIGAGFEGIAVSLVGSLTSIINGLIDFGANMQAAATEWKPYWDAIAPELEMVANSVGSVLAGLYEIVKGALSLITQVFGATFTALWPLISPALEMLLGFITTALESIGATFKATGLALQGDWKGAWDTLNKNSEEQLKQLETTINDTAPRLLEAGSNLGSALLNGFEGVAAGFTSIVADMLATGAE